MLAIARILRMKSRLILLDEPTEGLAPLLVKAIGEILAQIKREGITTLLVEQNSRFVTSVADRHYVLCHGKIVYEGTQRRLRAAGRGEEGIPGDLTQRTEQHGANSPRKGGDYEKGIIGFGALFLLTSPLGAADPVQGRVHVGAVRASRADRAE